MKLALIIKFLEAYAPPAYQEGYDNSGLIVGDALRDVQGAIVALDCTEKVLDEAIAKGCDLIITHHPIVFKGLKSITGKNYVERIVLKAIRNNIALYAIHTNLDHVKNGVNGVIGKRLGLQRMKVLSPKGGQMKKLVTFCPEASADTVRSALFEAGGGHIGSYKGCSFNTEGFGTFEAGDGANPYVGEIGKPHQEREIRIETVFKTHDQRKVLVALLESHPYEEVAYDVYELDNELDEVGAGMTGWLPEEMDGEVFLAMVKDKMNARVIRHTAILPAKIKKVAVCGGSGSFLLQEAIAAGADAFVTADFKYHEFFDAEDKLMIADIGHFESEQFTADLLVEIIKEKFPNFAIRLTEHNTNPINYFV